MHETCRLSSKLEARKRLITIGTFAPPWFRVTVNVMPVKTKTKTHCAQCEQTEDRCECEKYCVLCQSQLDIRLCTDGLYYCQPCREACEYKVSD
jgi:hypothetical protein